MKQVAFPLHTNYNLFHRLTLLTVKESFRRSSSLAQCLKRYFEPAWNKSRSNMFSIFRRPFAPPRDMILFVLTTWIGLTLSEKRVERHGISKDNLNNLIFYGLIAFVLGG